jgi:bifunctional non-homologous end joining protein LigD
MGRKLEEYGEKRDFKLTPEPKAQVPERQGPLIFVVQKHRARALHYDLRLEVDGVLKSWSVPKGPSLDPETKRLAVMVEDHPIDYAGFEGTIPKGEYGGGEVIVWDNGTYSPDEGGKFLFNDRAGAEAEMRQGLAKGKLSFFLRGHKLKGSWTLVKTRQAENSWLLMKHKDDYARTDVDILKEERSVLSGRTVEQVKASVETEDAPTTPLNPGYIPGAQTARFPSVIHPMLARQAEAPFSSPDWIFEPKLDGYRTMAHIQNGQVRLLSRRGIDVTQQYAALVPDLSRQPASELVLDGEIIALDEKGRQCFQCLQNYLRSLQRTKPALNEPVSLIYYIFDILYLDGYDLRGVALRRRKELLGNIFRPSQQVRLVDYFETEGERVYRAAVKNGLEGVMAKQGDSRYESGERSGSWLKVKSALSDEFVIGGYTMGQGSRAHSFGALLLGYYDEKGGLQFAGHVGTGLDKRALADLKNRLDALRTDSCPFTNVPETNTPAMWVRPELVAEVKFSEWTQDGRLRIPVFLRLREDKAPAEVRRTESMASSATDPAPADESKEVLEQLQKPVDSLVVEIEGNRISLGNLDKVLWPETRSHAPLTKRHFLAYLASVYSYFLPHLRDRPLTLSRYPGGIHGEHFWQKHWNNPLPDFVQRVNITEEEDKVHEYLVCRNLSTLIWLGQQADIEFHTWFSRIIPAPDMPAKKDIDYLLDYPDFIIFDLDPYIYSGKEKAGDEPELNRKAFDKVCEVALWLKEVVDKLSLKAFVKTSGKTGLHIYIPILRNLDYKAVRSAAETIGRFVLQGHPEDITMEWSVEKRKGKVFVDYNQNVRGKTLAAAYSPRPAPEATVSTPLRWNELGKVYPTEFTIVTLPERLKKTGDLWADILSDKRDIKKLVAAGLNK